MSKKRAPIPVYTIDLSKPPSERYVEPARDFTTQLREITVCFDELVKAFLPFIPLGFVRFIARCLLRGLHSKEETEEIRGVAKVAGVDMYLIVALNVLLDSLMGCTSGACQARGRDGKARMMHFRTLDWGMDPLRKVIVELQYVAKAGGPVIARSITYVGFVGVLTGVREGLSMSLNFRPYHNRPHGRRSDLKYRAHQILTMMGWRKPIATVLRELLLQEKLGPTNEKTKPGSEKKPPSPRSSAFGSVSSGESYFSYATSPPIQYVRNSLPAVPSTACYLTFTSPTSSLVLEKDLHTARPRYNENFIAICNHDATIQLDPADPSNPEHAGLPGEDAGIDSGWSDLIMSSDDRLDQMTENWTNYLRDHSLRRRPSQDQGGRGSPDTVEHDIVSPHWKRVRWWLQEYPISNEETHYACIMDPEQGCFVWSEMYEQVVGRRTWERWRGGGYRGP